MRRHFNDEFHLVTLDVVQVLVVAFMRMAAGVGDHCDVDVTDDGGSSYGIIVRPTPWDRPPLYPSKSR